MDDKTKTYRTKTGKVLTDTDVGALADEVEGDYDVEALKTRRRGRPPTRSAATEVVRSLSSGANRRAASTTVASVISVPRFRADRRDPPVLLFITEDERRNNPPVNERPASSAT